jgi:hypothetical protein
MRRITIRQMMIVVVLVALAFASLMRPSWLVDRGVYTLTWLFLLASIVCAVYHQRPRRYFWLGFAVFGCGHQLLATWEDVGRDREYYLLTTELFALLRTLLEDGVDPFLRMLVETAFPAEFDDARRGGIWHIYFSWFSLVVAYVAGLLTRYLFARRDRMEDESRGRAEGLGPRRSDDSRSDRGEVPDRDPRLARPVAEDSA